MFRLLLFAAALAIHSLAAHASETIRVTDNVYALVGEDFYQVAFQSLAS